MFNFLSQKFSSVLGWLNGKGRLSPENIAQAISQIREALFDADVPYDVVNSFLSGVEQKALGHGVTGSLKPGEQFIKIVYDQMVELLGGSEIKNAINFAIPSVILVIGLQGSGKTTTVAKLAKKLQEQAAKRGKKRRILLASVDYYRPAAREQLRILAQHIGVDYFEARATDPISATREIIDVYRSQRFEYLLLDTAGRLHVDNDLMAELVSVRDIAKPQSTILVLDGMTGQESLAVAQEFKEKISYDGSILTKMDSDARGGALVGFSYAVKKPVYFLGVGEKITDIEAFIPDRMASRILGMGDMLTLIERAEESAKKEEQEQMAQRMMSGVFTLQDFADQMDMVNKMGAIQQLVRYMPGSQQITPAMLDSGQREMKKFRAIISSMTPKERMVPQLLDASRKQRVARGAGVSVVDVNQLLQKFEQSKQFVKMLKKFGKLGSFFR